METLQAIGTLVAIPAGLVAIIAALIATIKWFRSHFRQQQAPLSAPEPTSEPTYEYCTIDWSKDRFTTMGYLVCKTPDGNKLYYKQPYETLYGVLSNAPSKRVRSHLQAHQDLMDRLTRDGWEHVDHPDTSQWYAERFRRRIDPR